MDITNYGYKAVNPLVPKTSLQPSFTVLTELDRNDLNYSTLQLLQMHFRNTLYNVLYFAVQRIFHYHVYFIIIHHIKPITNDFTCTYYIIFALAF